MINADTMLKRVAMAVVMAALVTACANTGRPYLPSSDPLVLEVFEHSLNEERIAYTRDYQGRYQALDAADQGRLLALGERARRLDPGRERLRLTVGCASRKLRDYLRGAEALFALDRTEEGTYLVMLESDFRELDVAGRYAAFQEECGT